MNSLQLIAFLGDKEEQELKNGRIVMRDSSHNRTKSNQLVLSTTTEMNENETYQENKVFGNQSTYNLMEMKGQSFLSQMYHEVLFRKKNDMDFDYLTRNDTKE